MIPLKSNKPLRKSTKPFGLGGWADAVNPPTQMDGRMLSLDHYRMSEFAANSSMMKSCSDDTQKNVA